jgi:CRP/FNR family cyclic AMP-dependent transcriptional regulator
MIGSQCVEVCRNGTAILLQRKPLVGMDLFTAESPQLHAAQELARTRTTLSINESIERDASFGEGIAGQVGRFGGTWTFVLIFGVLEPESAGHQESLA